MLTTRHSNNTYRREVALSQGIYYYMKRAGDKAYNTSKPRKKNHNCCRSDLLNSKKPLKRWAVVGLLGPAAAQHLCNIFWGIRGNRGTIPTNDDPEVNVARPR